MLSTDICKQTHTHRQQRSRFTSHDWGILSTCYLSCLIAAGLIVLQLAYGRCVFWISGWFTTIQLHLDCLSLIIIIRVQGLCQEQQVIQDAVEIIRHQLIAKGLVFKQQVRFSIIHILRSVLNLFIIYFCFCHNTNEPGYKKKYLWISMIIIFINNLLLIIIIQIVTILFNSNTTKIICCNLFLAVNYYIFIW